MRHQVVIVEDSRAQRARGRQILGMAASAVVVCGLLISHPHFGSGSVAAPAPVGPPPQIAQPQVTSGNDRLVIAVGRSGTNNRCDVQGFANGVATDFEIDTGDPNEADFPGSYIRKLNIGGPLDYHELDPGTRYGKIAPVKLRQIRIDNVVWNNPTVYVYSDWDYTFGSDEIPLLGLPALKERGVNVEFDKGDTCRLTVARNHLVAQKRSNSGRAGS